MTQQNNNTRPTANQQDSGRTITNDNNSDNRRFSNNIESANDENPEMSNGGNGEAKGGNQNNNANNKLSGDNTVKDPDNWTTGNEPMTGAQSSYLHTLASEAGEVVDENLTKAEASKKIDELQHKTGRGLQGTDDSA